MIDLNNYLVKLGKYKKFSKRLSLYTGDNFDAKSVLKVMKYIYDKIIPAGDLVCITVSLYSDDEDSEKEEINIRFYISGKISENNIAEIKINGMLLLPVYVDDLIEACGLSNLDSITI